MKIWIDADACPRVVKEILFRASARLQVPLCLVANKSLAKHAGTITEGVCYLTIGDETLETAVREM